ncbi:MAG: helix-turn-helix domain-containing protein [Oscillospiraceae bacterium]
MSLFSENLNSIIKKRNISIKRLAESIDVDRTVLQKIITGSRKPANREIVEKICDKLMLSSDIKNTLLEQYEIAVMGEEIYKRRQYVAKIINDLSHKKFELDKSIDFKTQIDLENIPGTTFCNDHNDLLKNIQIIISYEFQNGSDVNIIAQPSKTLNSILKYCIDEKAENKINHVFCMDNSPIDKNPLKYNLNIFSYVSELAYENKNYCLYYYYGDIVTNMSFMGVLPYMIITNDFVVCSNPDYSSGIIYKSRNHVDFYSRQFNEILMQKSKLISVINDFDFYYCSKDILTRSFTYNYQSEFSLCLDSDIFDRYSLLDDDHKYMKDFLFNLNSSTLNYESKNIFTEKGLEEFTKTGRMTEIPEYMYKPISVKDRKAMLKRMIDFAESGIYNYRIVKSNYNIFNNKLCIGIMDNSRLMIQLFNGFKYLIIEETSIVMAFKDYLEFLFDSDMVYNKEETISIMKKHLED